MTNAEAADVLHLLIAKTHLFLGGWGTMTRAEMQLVTDIDEWWRTTGVNLATARRAAA